MRPVSTFLDIQLSNSRAETKAAGIFISVFLPCVPGEILENCKSL